MRRSRIKQIINEEIIGRYVPSPLKNVKGVSETERMAELVIDDYFTEVSRMIYEHVNGRAEKYKLTPAAVKATIAALDELFTEKTLKATVLRMHNLFVRQSQRGGGNKNPYGGGVFGHGSGAHGNY